MTYSVVKRYPRTGRPTGLTCHTGSLEECRQWVEDNSYDNPLLKDEYAIIFGDLESATYTDSQGFLFFKDGVIQ